MLRWCLPAVRAMGGWGNASFNIRTLCSVRLASKLTLEGRSWSLYTTTARATTHDERNLGPPTDDVAVSYDEAHVSEPDATLSSLIYPQRPVTPESTLPSQRLPDSSRRELDVASPRPKSNSSRGASAILALKALLSSDNLARPKPTVYTANTIRSIYRSVKAYGLLRDLTATELSALISLFGSLSLSSPGVPYRSIYAHSLAAHLPDKGKSGRSYWTLIAELVLEKKRLHRRLSRSDHFYAMHAQLGGLLILDESSQTKHLTMKIKQTLAGARSHYECIRSIPFHLDAHIPYLEALLRRPERVGDAINTFCDVVLRLPYINAKLLDYLWRLVMASSQSASPSQKTKLLELLSSRAHNALANAAYLPSHDTPVTSGDTHSVAVEDLRQSLSYAITCNTTIPNLAASSYPHLLRWSLEAAISELSSDPRSGHLVDVAWAQLYFIASSQRHSLPVVEGLRLRDNPGGSWSWKVICILSQVENALRERNTRTDLCGRNDSAELATIRRILESLWYKWSAAQSREPRIFLPVTTAIITSFLQIARQTGDIEFIENSWSFLHASGFFAAREVAMEYCAATIAHGHDIRQIFLTVLPHVRPASRSLVVQGVLTRLLLNDVDLGLRVYAWAQQSQLPIDPDTLGELVARIATCGRAEDALHYLSDPRLRVEHKLYVLTIILQHAVDPSRILPSPGSLSQTVNTLVRVHRSPSLPPKGFEESLLAALKLRRLSRLPHLIEIIQRNWPSFFSEQFQILAAEEFARQRQPRMALRLLCRARLANKDTQRTFMHKLVHAGAHKAAASILKRPWPQREQASVSSNLLQLLRFQHDKRPHLRWLKAPTLLSAASTSAEVQLVSKFLVSTGRLRSPMLMRAGSGALQLERNRTVLGNAIIHSVAHGPKRQARRVRNTLEVFNKLRKEQNFVPDRVTVNVLLKTMLHWTKAVDAQAVRTLFDRMVRSGYPAGDSLAPGVGPFGTDSASGVRFEVPEISSPIVYATHVRPLYKMFIKALYLRGDVQGARVIVGILKGLEASDRLTRVQRVLLAVKSGRRS